MTGTIHLEKELRGVFKSWGEDEKLGFAHAGYEMLFAHPGGATQKAVWHK